MAASAGLRARWLQAAARSAVAVARALRGWRWLAGSPVHPVPAGRDVNGTDISRPTDREVSDSDSDIIFGYPDVFSDIGFGYNMGNIRRILDIRSDNPDR